VLCLLPSGAGSIRCRLVLIPPRYFSRIRLQLSQSLDLLLDYLELFQLKLKAKHVLAHHEVHQLREGMANLIGFTRIDRYYKLLGGLIRLTIRLRLFFALQQPLQLLLHLLHLAELVGDFLGRLAQL